MARDIIIDEDTTVGFSYENSYYYIVNKNTQTTRNTAAEIKEILDIVAPANTITIEDLYNLKTYEETLRNVYYTWEDTGAYIKTIQLNTYAEHPLTIDLTAKKLYIMNSDLIYDLTLNESINYRTPYLINYYKDVLGLTVTKEQMDYLYLKLTSYYSPTYYIEIAQREGTTKSLFYTNEIKLSNYNNKAPLTYTLQYNPNNVYEEGTSLADIVYVNANTRTIQLRTSIPSSLRVEDKILITDSTVNEFTADGIYTIQGLDTEANIIQVEEFIPNSYEVQYLPCYKVVAQATVSSINRDNYTITLTSSTVPNNIQIGDKIRLRGTTQLLEGERVTADGTYTIANIQGNTIIVGEQIPVSFNVANVADIYKAVPVAYISKIASNKVTLYAEPTITLEASNKVVIKDTLFGVASYSNKVITLNAEPLPYTQPFAHLRQPVQQPLVEVTVQDSTLTNIPNGSFIVDNFAQAISYTSLIISQPTLPSTFESNLSNRVAMKGAIQLQNVSDECIGLYSEVYTDT